MLTDEAAIGGQTPSHRTPGRPPRPEWLDEAESDVDALRRCAPARRQEMIESWSASRGKPKATIRTYMSFARNLRRLRLRDPKFAEAIEASGFNMLRAAMPAHAINADGARAVIAGWESGAIRTREAVAALKALPPEGRKAIAPDAAPTRSDVAKAERAAIENEFLKTRLALLEGLAQDACEALLDDGGRWRGIANAKRHAATAVMTLSALVGHRPQRAANAPRLTEASHSSKRPSMANPMKGM